MPDAGQRSGRPVPDGYRIATQHYWWRLGKAFFCALELDAYLRARVQVKHPVLDLGCGDGTFTSMLRSAGLADPVDFALDYAARQRARGRRPASHTVQADARLLPFRAGALASVIANGVLSSIPCKEEREIDLALLAVRAVLRDGGLFLLTVPTPSFTRSFCIPPILRGMKLHRLADAYERQVSGREAHYLVFDEGAWRRKLQATGFEVEQVRECLTAQQGRWYGVLRAQPLRAMNLLRVIPLASISRAAAGVEERLFRKLANPGQAAPGRAARPAAYLLIVAWKQGVSGPPATFSTACPLRMQTRELPSWARPHSGGRAGASRHGLSRDRRCR